MQPTRIQSTPPGSLQSLALVAAIGLGCGASACNSPQPDEAGPPPSEATAPAPTRIEPTAAESQSLFDSMLARHAGGFRAEYLGTTDVDSRFRRLVEERTDLFTSCADQRGDEGRVFALRVLDELDVSASDWAWSVLPEGPLDERADDWSPRGQVWSGALDALVGERDPRVVPLLIRCLHDGSGRGDDLALYDASIAPDLERAHALGCAAGTATPELCAKRFRGSENHLHLRDFEDALVTKLGEIGAPDSPVVLETFRSAAPNTPLRSDDEALIRDLLGPSADLTDRFAEIAEGLHAGRRRNALHAIVASPVTAESLAWAVAEAREDSDPGVRAVVLRGLARLRSPELEGRVLEALRTTSNAERGLRLAAVEVSADVANEDVSDLLMGIVAESPDPLLNQRAARTLGQQRCERAAPILLDRLDGEFAPGVSVEPYVRALLEIGPPVHPSLEAYVRSDRPGRMHVARTLADEHHPLCDPILGDAVEREDLPVVAAGYSYFIRQGRPESVAILGEALTEHGTTTMAQHYVSSGEPRLKSFALRWAAEHGVPVVTVPSPSGITTNAPRGAPGWGKE